MTDGCLASYALRQSAQVSSAGSREPEICCSALGARTLDSGSPTRRVLGARDPTPYGAAKRLLRSVERCSAGSIVDGGCFGRWLGDPGAAWMGQRPGHLPLHLCSARWHLCGTAISALASTGTACAARASAAPAWALSTGSCVRQEPRRVCVRARACVQTGARAPVFLFTAPRADRWQLVARGAPAVENMPPSPGEAGAASPVAESPPRTSVPGPAQHWEQKPEQGPTRPPRTSVPGTRSRPTSRRSRRGGGGADRASCLLRVPPPLRNRRAASTCGPFSLMEPAGRARQAGVAGPGVEGSVRLDHRC